MSRPGESKTLTCLTLQKPTISTGSMGHLAQKWRSVYIGFSQTQCWRSEWSWLIFSSFLLFLKQKYILQILKFSCNPKQCTRNLKICNFHCFLSPIPSSAKYTSPTCTSSFSIYSNPSELISTPRWFIFVNCCATHFYQNLVFWVASVHCFISFLDIFFVSLLNLLSSFPKQEPSVFFDFAIAILLCFWEL